MTIKITSAVAILALLTACATTTEPAATAAPAAQATSSAAATAVSDDPKDQMDQSEKVAAYNEQQADAKDKVVCRTITPTGSHRKKTICRTVRESEEERRSAQEAMRQIQNPGTRTSN